MANPYEIPGAGPPDLSPAISLFLAARNRSKENARADEYVQMQRDAMKHGAERESAALARQKAEDERRHAIEAHKALPDLMRAAQKSVGLANANPYGIKFEEAVTPPDQTKANDEVSRFLADKPTGMMPETPGHADRQLRPNEEGPEQMPDAEAARFAGTDELMGQATTGAPMDLMSQAAANAFGPDTRRISATYQGQRFDVPQTSDTTGLGHEYDALYQSLLDAGEKSHDALKIVTAQYKSDKTQEHIADRTAQQIEARRGMQSDRFDFGREMGLNRDDKLSEAEKNRVAAMERAKVGGQYRVAAAAPALKIDTANRQDMGTLRQGFKEWKNTVNLAIDSKSHKRLATALSNLESGNAMQQREAAESLVSIFKGGGQVTKASQDLLLHHLAGYVGDVQSFLQKAESGHFGARELNVLKQATRNAMTEETERLHALHESARDSFGPGSGYEQLGANVNAMVKGAFKQFGYDAPDIYEGASEPVVLGSGQRPKAPKAPAAKPQTVTIRNKKTGETKEVSLEEARKMGAAP